jgi:hypothetical protein
MKDIDERVVRISARAWNMALELEAHCERSGLDSYMQAQIILCSVSDPEEVALWSEVWNYVQARESAGWDDRFLVCIEPEVIPA